MSGVYYSIMRTTHPDLVCLLFVPSLYSFEEYFIYIIIIAHAHCTKYDSQYTSTTYPVSSSLIGAECRNVLVHNVSLFPHLQNERKLKRHYNQINSGAEINCITIAISPDL